MSKKKKSTAQQRSRNFFIVSYLNEKQIKKVIGQHQNNIKAYAYGYHDKDEGKQPHYHIVLKLINATSKTAVQKWFRGFFDEKNLLINTMTEYTNCTTSAVSYIAHEDVNGIPLKDKYHYGREILKSYKLGKLEDPIKNDKDKITEAVLDMLDGKPMKEIVVKYGRDFIIHYHSIKKLYEDIIYGG